MSQAIFYKMPQLDEPATTPAHYLLACRLITAAYRQGQRVFVHCQDQQQAEMLDELLWQQPTDAFVPHSLQGESEKAPVQIGWLGAHTRCDLLVNLAQIAPRFASQFAKVIDFVPIEPQLTELARQRFRDYRTQGIELQAVDADN